MIKLGICIDCKTYDNCRTLEVPIIAGRCQFHYKVFRAKECAKRNVNKPISFRKPILKKTYEGKRTIKIENLVSWYEARLNEFTGNCAECGERIDRRYCYASVAHVLPKSLFPSVAKHEENAIELGGLCGCHTKYDKNWLSASKMKVFPLAVEKFKKIEPFIAEEERRRIPEIFLNESKV